MELAACQNGKLPEWLNDEALDDASRVDRYSLSYVNRKDLFAGETTPGGSNLPPPPPRPTDHGADAKVASIMGERQDFKRWCDGIRVGQRLKIPAR